MPSGTNIAVQSSCGSFREKGGETLGDEPAQYVLWHMEGVFMDWRGLTVIFSDLKLAFSSHMRLVWIIDELETDKVSLFWVFEKRDMEGGWWMLMNSQTSLCITASTSAVNMVLLKSFLIWKECTFPAFAEHIMRGMWAPKENGSIDWGDLMAWRWHVAWEHHHC